MKKRIALLLGAALLFAGFAQAAEKPLIRIGAQVLCGDFGEHGLFGEHPRARPRKPASST